MEYMLLIYVDEAAGAAMTPEDGEKMHLEYMAFSQELAESGAMVGGSALQGTDTATTVRVRNGSTTTTDGPFAETKEVLGGYYIVECEDLDQAIGWAAKIPGARTNSVEVRPLLDVTAPATSRS
jgi:hypothetical protein